MNIKPVSTTFDRMCGLCNDKVVVVITAIVIAMVDNGGKLYLGVEMTLMGMT